MKILLQPEAKKISNYELERNQQYLIELYRKIYRLFSRFSFNLHQFERRNTCR